VKTILAATLAVLILAAGWFFVSPLFIDNAIDEDFAIVGDDGVLDMVAVMRMPPADREAMRDEIMDAAARAPDIDTVESMSMAGPRALARGSFVDADAVHRGSGGATLYELPNGRHVVRFEDFRSTNGPDLYVYLAKHPSPAEAADVTDGGYLSLGKLKGNVGNQNYPLPEGTDVSEYNSVVIWCQLFGVLFSPAALSPVTDPE